MTFQRCAPDFPLCAGIDPAPSLVDHLAEDRLAELLVRSSDDARARQEDRVLGVENLDRSEMMAVVNTGVTGEQC